MNQIVISRTHGHGTQNENAVIIIESPLSVIDFDNLFRNALFAFFTGWKKLDELVKEDLKVCHELQEGTPEYKSAMLEFTTAFDSQVHFEENHKTFVHGDFKILLTPFVTNDEVCDFSVLSLTDWVAIKTAESSVGFNHE